MVVWNSNISFCHIKNVVYFLENMAIKLDIYRKVYDISTKHTIHYKVKGVKSLPKSYFVYLKNKSLCVNNSFSFDECLGEHFNDWLESYQAVSTETICDML